MSKRLQEVVAQPPKTPPPKPVAPPTKKPAK